MPEYEAQNHPIQASHPNSNQIDRSSKYKVTYDYDCSVTGGADIQAAR